MAVAAAAVAESITKSKDPEKDCCTELDRLTEILWEEEKKVDQQSSAKTKRHDFLCSCDDNGNTGAL